MSYTLRNIPLGCMGSDLRFTIVVRVECQAVVAGCIKKQFEKGIGSLGLDNISRPTDSSISGITLCIVFTALKIGQAMGVRPISKA